MENWSSELREVIYEQILRSGAAGLTDEEISHQLDVTGDTARPRRNELVTNGLVVKAGFRRATQRGRTASVWLSRKIAEKKPKNKANNF